RASDSYYRRHGLRGFELRRYNQSHEPVREQTKVVGHAVRAMYLYSGMADIATEYNDDSLTAALETLWDDLTTKQIYITGASVRLPPMKASPIITTCPTPPPMRKPARPSAWSS